MRNDVGALMVWLKRGSQFDIVDWQTATSEYLCIANTGHRENRIIDFTTDNFATARPTVSFKALVVNVNALLLEITE